LYPESHTRIVPGTVKSGVISPGTPRGPPVRLWHTGRSRPSGGTV